MIANAPLLVTEGLTRLFGGVTAVDSLDLTLDRGEILGVIGPNGAGKSTLMALLSGALRPSAGRVRFAGRDVTDAPPHLRARLGIARTYQVPQPFAAMSVLDNVLLARLHGRRAEEPGSRADVDRILERTGLGAFAGIRAGELGLLRLKRLELARAMALHPRLLLLDEIGAGLIDAELRELIALLRELRSEVDGILIVEHVLEVITACSDRVLVLDWGRKLTEGPLGSVLGDARVAAVYLGTVAETVTAVDSERQPPEAAPLLEVRNVAAGYGAFRALHDVTLRVDAGEAVTLLGANGAGKTTTARVISGMVRPSSGEVRFEGAEIDGRPPHEIVGLGIAHCMEGRRIFGDLSVEENLLLAGPAGPRAEVRRRLDRVYELFEVLGTKRRDSGSSLSGGQQQMLAIGRALMAEPKLIIFDEISLGLAPVVLDQLYDALARLNESGVAMLVIEQNVERGLALAHRAYVLEHGAVALSGRPLEIRDDARLRALYVGEATG